MGDKLKAIFFDVGGTLIRPWPSVGAVYAAVGQRHGIRKRAAEMERAFRCAWKQHKELTGPQVDASTGQAAVLLKTGDKQWWRRLVMSALERCDLPPNPPYFEELYATFGQAAAWRPFDDVAPTLDMARHRGLHIGIISNWDERLRPLLLELNLGTFDSITISCEVRAEKPSSAIFRAALDRAGVPSRHALHVGDSYDEDVRGATSLGMRGLLIDRAAPASAGQGTIRDLREIFRAALE